MTTGGPDAYVARRADGSTRRPDTARLSVAYVTASVSEPVDESAGAGIVERVLNALRPYPSWASWGRARAEGVPPGARTIGR